MLLFICFKRGQNMMDDIYRLTEKLLVYNGLCLNYYQQGRERQEKKDFYAVIKPFADEVKEVNEEWKDMMKKWLSSSSPGHIHLKQIDSISDHIEKLSIQAFFPETSKSRFINTHRTVDYFLQEVLNTLEKQEKRC